MQAARPGPPYGRLGDGSRIIDRHCLNNIRDFQVGKLRHNLEKIKAIGFQANRRLLRVQRLSHDCMVGADRFKRLRAPDLRFGERRVQVLSASLPKLDSNEQPFGRTSNLARLSLSLTTRAVDRGENLTQ